jgi:RNA polymerase sigma-70 factor (ECF subfamily)
MTVPVTDLTAVLNERELVRRAATGDARAQRALYDAHVDRVYRLTYRLAGDDDLAADLTQETFIRAFDRLGEFRHESALGTWLHTIAVSVALGALRKQKRRAVRHAPLDEAVEVGRTDRVADADLRERLHEAIDALPEGYRTVFVMYEVEGYTHQEIASALGVQVTTSKGQLFRAKARLREALKHFAGGTTQ